MKKHTQVNIGTFLIILFAIIVAITIETGKYTKQKEESDYEKALETKIKQNPEEIISEIERLISTGDFLMAHRTANKFRRFENAKIEELASQAWEEHCEQHEKRIIAKLKNIPATQYKANINEYAKLVSMFPENEIYKYKLKHYREKLYAKQAKEREEQQERFAKFGEKPIASTWDGSYSEVKHYLKRVANDPDSIDIDGCTQVYRTESGWLVGCDYRGKNAFGGFVRNSNWFTIRHGQVVKMEGVSTYNP